MNNKKKFSIVDLAIIFAFICIVGGIVFRTYNKGSFLNNSDKVQIEYTLQIKETDKTTRKLLNVNDRIFLADKNIYYGYVSGCNRTSARTYEKDENGSMIIVTDTSAIDITLSVRADAVKTQYGYCINADTYIVPGQRFTFTTSQCEFDALITAIKVIDNDNIG